MITSAHSYRFFSGNHGEFRSNSISQRFIRRATWVKRGLLAALLCGVFALAVGAAPPPASYDLALIEFHSGEFRQASRILEEALRNGSQDAAAELLLSRCYYEMKDWDRAAAHAQTAVQIDPQNAEAHVSLGEIYGRKAEQERSLTLAVKTRREFEKAVSLDPANLDARRDLMEFYLDAPWLLGGGTAKAEKQAEAIAALNPVAGHLARAKMDEKAGQTARAEAEIRGAIVLKPDRVGPYMEAAKFFQSQRDVAGMEMAVDAAAKLDRSDARVAYYRGVIGVLKGKRLAEAERELKVYLAAAHPGDFPSHASALSWLGEAYELQGKPQLATQQYHAALQLDPHLPAAQAGLDRISDPH